MSGSQSWRAWFACKANKLRTNREQPKIFICEWTNSWDQRLNSRLKQAPWPCLPSPRSSRRWILIRRYFSRLSTKREVKPEPWTLNAYGFPSRAAFSAAPSAFPALIPPASPDLSTGWSQVTGLISPQEQIPPSPTEPAYTPVEAALGGGGGGGGNVPPDRDDGNGGNGDRPFGKPRWRRWGSSWPSAKRWRRRWRWRRRKRRT